MLRIVFHERAKLYFAFLTKYCPHIRAKRRPIQENDVGRTCINIRLPRAD